MLLRLRRAFVARSSEELALASNATSVDSTPAVRALEKRRGETGDFGIGSIRAGVASSSRAAQRSQHGQRTCIRHRLCVVRRVPAQLPQRPGDRRPHVVLRLLSQRSHQRGQRLFRTASVASDSMVGGALAAIAVVSSTQQAQWRSLLAHRPLRWPLASHLRP